MIGNHTLQPKEKNNNVVFKKSPIKFQVVDVKGQKNAFTKSVYQSENSNSWNMPSYNAIKKIPSEYANLRKTFDLKNTQKIKATINSQKTQNNQSVIETIETSNKQTIKLTKSKSNMTNEAKKGASVKTIPLNEDEEEKKFTKSNQQLKLQDKYKEYMMTLEKFKDQAQANCKMSQQLKKLKQDRKRRMQAKQKQMQKYQINLPQDSSEAIVSKTKSSRVIKTVTNIAVRQTPTFRDEKKSKTITFLNQMGSKPKICDFVIGKSLGQGKFGSVFQVIHKKTGSLYALKKIPKQMIKSHLMVDQFLLQLKIQTYFYHQNILQIHTFFDDKDNIYLVLEYMEEGTLFSHLKKHKKLPEAQVSSKIAEIASAVKYLHQNSIAHRDIKPENIVISHGVCKLCDFGWATICDQRRKTYCGTFDYAPPQILEGQEYDYTVDLWCLGVLTYQLLVGKAPFYHISRKETMKKIINVQNSQIDYPKTLSSRAVSFIDQLLKKNPTDRMTAEDVLNHPFLQ